MTQNSKDQVHYVGNGTIQLRKKLGEGAFGEIFIGIILKNSVEVAVKRESMSNNRRQLETEYKTLESLKSGD